MNKMPNHRDKEYGGAWPVEDKDVIEFLLTHNGVSHHKKFINDYYEWFKKPHTLRGVENFKHLAFCNGTTEAFDKFYIKHMSRRLRFLQGEYFYHQIVAKRFFQRSSYIGPNIDIGSNDVVVMSVPFSDTGNVPELYNDIMEACEQLNVPVLLDMAYINLAVDLNINLEYDCIDTITTSLSKVFPVSNWRIGIRLQQHNIDDTLDAYEINSYLNSHSVNVGHKLIKRYGADYSHSKYKDKQYAICKRLNLSPSESYIFGIDEKNLYPEYNRGGTTNRLCFAKHY